MFAEEGKENAGNVTALVGNRLKFTQNVFYRRACDNLSSFFFIS